MTRSTAAERPGRNGRRATPTTLDDEHFRAPAQQEAERALLGSILLRPDVLDELEIAPGDFFFEAHRLLFEHVIGLWNAAKKIDLTTLLASLKGATGGDVQALEIVGGAAGLAELFAAQPTAGNARFYADAVREAAVLRQLQQAAVDTLDDVRLGVGATEALASAERRVYAIGEGASRAADATPIGDCLTLALDELDARRQGQGKGISTGLAALDSITGGLRPGLWILAAATSMGKTSLATQIASHAASRRKSVLFVSLEMNRVEVAERILCAAAKVDSFRVRSGALRADEVRLLIETQAEIGKHELRIDDTPSRTVGQIAAACRRIKRRNGLDLLIVDYLQQIEADDRRAPRQEQVAAISRRLKILQRELGIPILCLAQLNRQYDATTLPKLSHLRESGAIEQDADVVIFIHCPGYYEARSQKPEGEEAILVIAKQRGGPTGQAKVLWHARTTRFANMDGRDPDEFEQGQFFGSDF